MADSSKGSELPPGEDHIPLATETNPTAQSTSEMRNVQLGDVPNVEVRAKGAGDTTQTELQSEASASLGSGQSTRDVPYNHLNPEQQRALEEKLKREQAQKYFSLREGAFQKAVEECKLSLIDPAADGNVLSTWLLTEIDHWDLEKERIILITDKQLVIAKYNFIGIRVEDHRKVPLIKCDKVQTGRFAYPKNTMMIPRHFQNGLRIYCGKNDLPSYSQSWNPWSKEIPFITVRDHRGCAFLDQVPPYLQVNLFNEEIVPAIRSAHSKLLQGVEDESLEIAKEPVPMNIYVGVSTLTHNLGILGFNRDRGKYGY